MIEILNVIFENGEKVGVGVALAFVTMIFLVTLFNTRNSDNKEAETNKNQTEERKSFLATIQAINQTTAQASHAFAEVTVILTAMRDDIAKNTGEALLQRITKSFTEASENNRTQFFTDFNTSMLELPHPLGVVTFAPEGRAVSANREAALLLGVSEVDFLSYFSRTPNKIFVYDDMTPINTKELVRNIVLNRQTLTFFARCFQETAQRHVWLVVTAVPSFQSSGEAVLDRVILTFSKAGHVMTERDYA